MPVQLSHHEITIPNGMIGVFNIGQNSRRFPTRILNADVVITGFTLRYDASDREVAAVQVRAKWIANNNNTPGASFVNFEVRAQLADQNADDPYNGSVSVLVIAVTE
jgi:hypothetical protein